MDGNKVTTLADWPGTAAEYAGHSYDGKEVYRAVFDNIYENIIFCDNAFKGAQTVDIQHTGSNTMYIADDNYTEREADGVHVHSVSSASYTQNPVMGDADTNGVININDVTSIQLALVGLKDLTNAQRIAGNIHKNNRLSIRDVTLIQLYLAGRIDI